MEMFDTHFVYFGQILPVSGMKTLVIGVKFKNHECINKYIIFIF